MTRLTEPSSHRPSPGRRRLGLTPLVGLLALAWGAANAASPQRAPTAPPDPLDAAAPVPPAVHRSVLRGGWGRADASAVPWAEANRTVNQVGGWRAYAREKLPAEPETGGSAPRTPN